MQTPIEQFAEQHRLRVSRDECNDQIIEGRRGQIYFDDDIPCFMALDRKVATRSTWDLLGGKLWIGDISPNSHGKRVQDVKVIGFTNAGQAIRMAGLFAKRELSPEHKAKATAALAKNRANRVENASPAARIVQAE